MNKTNEIKVTITTSAEITLLPEDFEHGETLEEVAEYKLAKLQRERALLNTETVGVSLLTKAERAA